MAAASGLPVDRIPAGAALAEARPDLEPGGDKESSKESGR